MMSSKPSTTYGTIPTPPITGPVSTTAAAATTFRSWRELLNPSSISLPDTYQDALARIRYNLSYFTFNYTVTLLFILFLTLLYHPISMIIFIALFLLWYFLYFSQLGQGKIVIFGHLVEERLVLLGLWVVTVVGLVLTGVGVNVLVGLCVGVVVVGLHAGLRGTEDLFLNEEFVGVDGDSLVSVVGSQTDGQSRNYSRI